jgi:3-deoxy-manno-octulosonate cytidylyltransferase (CMP-KDO synthetase)
MVLAESMAVRFSKPLALGIQINARLASAWPTVAKLNPVNVLGIIPARYASTRFPGKPLAPIAGKPLIQRVVEQCRKAESLSDVIVATDDARIAEVAKRFCRVEMTRADHPSGSDRIAEVAARCDCDAVVNIQGDEPLIDPAVIDAVAGALARDEMSTAATPIKNPADLDNPNVVKVVVSAAGRALYFSRRTIPYLREGSARASRAVESAPLSTHPVDEASTVTREARVLPDPLAAFVFLKHLGIYGYRRETLLRLVKFPVSPLEGAEKLEQLRALENGIPIAVVKVDYDSVGVDVPEDIKRVEQILRNHG